MWARITIIKQSKRTSQDTLNISHDPFSDLSHDSPDDSRQGLTDPDEGLPSNPKVPTDLAL
jgi:hypothetical protein